MVQSRAIPGLNENVIGRPLHSFTWSASDQQQWWDWGQVADDANNAYDWANPPIVSLVWRAQSGSQVAGGAINDTYMDLSCLIQGPPTKYVTSIHGPSYSDTAAAVEPGILSKIDPMLSCDIDWDAVLADPGAEST